MRILIPVILLFALAALSGCTFIDETDRRAADFVARALPERPALAAPVAEALSGRLGKPKAPAELTEAGRDALVAEAGKPKGGALNLLGKLLMGALTLAVTAAGGQGLGRDC